MRVVALTGGIACGKTTVARRFAGYHGITVVDSDVITHDLQQPGTVVFDRIVATFGREIVGEDGTIDRKALGNIIFNDAAKRRKLNGIVHPAVFRCLIKAVVKSWISRKTVVILDIPLFFEARVPQWPFSDIVTVAARRDEQLHRLILRDGDISEEHAKSRISSQLSIEEKCERATIVLENDGSVDDVFNKVDALAKEWKARRKFGIFIDPVVLSLIVIVIAWLVARHM